MQKEKSRQTGPNTTDGKARSSQNSTKHSLLANPNKLLPGETQEEYNAVWDPWAAEYDSESPGTARLLEPLVNSDRMVRFTTTAVINAQIALAQAEDDPESDPDRLDRLHKDLQNKLRYQTKHERSFALSLRNIEQFGQRRVREANAAQRLEILACKVACVLVLKLYKAGIDYKTVLPLILPFLNTMQPKSPDPEEATPPIL